ncbi:MAG TPA: DHA2 family efflux MFS transporter permease subunit [Acidimicrobiales bacterium]|nr:DHA2 family efflux MFS transporter permease subunit [Acidimicrobiales bacterium]
MTQLIDTRVPAAPDRSDDVDRRRWWTLAALCTSLILITVDTTILNVAIPTISRALGSGTGELQWIVDAYTVAFAGLLLTGGSLGDRLGRRRALTAGLVVFGAGCALSAMVSSPGPLIVMRGITGAGAALIFPATLSILTNTFRDPAERQRAIAIWAGTAGIGIALGPLAGGLLLEHFYWGSVFLVNLPVIVVALIAIRVAVPESRDPTHRRLDVVGAFTSIAGLAIVVFGIIRGGSHAWTDRYALTSLVGGMLLVGTFILVELRTSDPMLDLRVFRNRRFTGASVAVAVVYFCLFGTIFLMTQQLQLMLGYGALAAGVRTVPFALVLMVVANTTPKLVGRFGARALISSGLVIVAVSQLIRATSTIDTGYGPLLASQLSFALGMGLIIAPATATIMGAIPMNRAGVGSAVNDTTRQVGGALGVAVMGSLATSAYHHTLNERVSSLGLSDRALGDSRASLGGALRTAQELPSTPLADAARQGFIDGLRVASIVAVVVALAGAAVAWRLLPRRALAAAPSRARTESTQGVPLPTTVDGFLMPPPAADLIGLELTNAAGGRSTFRFVPEYRHYNPMSIVHGGILTTVLDSAMGMALGSTLAPDQRFATVQLDVRFLHPVTERTGPLVADGWVQHRGGSFATVQAELHDDQARLLATATSTCAIRERRIGGDEIAAAAAAG